MHAYTERSSELHDRTVAFNQLLGPLLRSESIR